MISGSFGFARGIVAASFCGAFGGTKDIADSPTRWLSL